MFLVLCCTCDPRKTVENIMLRVAGTGMLALSRNELFAATQTIAADPDDPEAEVPGEERAWVPSVGLGEQLFTVPTYFLMQVHIRPHTDLTSHMHQARFIL